MSARHFQETSFRESDVPGNVRKPSVIDAQSQFIVLTFNNFCKFSLHNNDDDDDESDKDDKDKLLL